jgi:hypothetical protein
METMWFVLVLIDEAKKLYAACQNAAWGPRQGGGQQLCHLGPLPEQSAIMVRDQLNSILRFATAGSAPSFPPPEPAKEVRIHGQLGRDAVYQTTATFVLARYDTPAHKSITWTRCLMKEELAHDMNLRQRLRMATFVTVTGEMKTAETGDYLLVRDISFDLQ